LTSLTKITWKIKNKTYIIRRQMAVAWLKFRIPASRSSPLAEVALKAAGIRSDSTVSAKSDDDVCAAK
jgi:hypothetical protein